MLLGPHCLVQLNKHSTPLLRFVGFLLHRPNPRQRHLLRRHPGGALHHLGPRRRRLYRSRSQPTVGVARYGPEVSDPLSSVGEELPVRKKVLVLYLFQDY